MAVKNLLVINPNTSAAVTQKLAGHIAQQLGAGVAVHAVTARLGAPYIDSEVSYAIAGHAVLDAYEAYLAGTESNGKVPDAVVVGCFGDPGVFALREMCGAPVLGLAEAAFIEAAAVGRFAVVTGGERWKAILQRFAQSAGFAEQLACIHTVAPSGAQLAADPVGARAMLARACREAAQQSGARCVILGGAGLAGMAQDIAPHVPVPVIDSVLAGARQIALTRA